MDKYRFYIGLAGEEVEVFPLNTNKLKFEDKPEEGQIFFRKKMVGKVKFYKQDFDYLYELEKSVDRCETLTLRVEQLCSGSYEDYWLGTFSLNDGKWDIDNCNVELEAKVKDKYSCILDNKKKPVNILELSTLLPTQADLMPIGLQYSKVCIGSLTLPSKFIAAGPSGRYGSYTVPDVSDTELPNDGEYINDCVVEAEGWQVYKVVYRDKVPGEETWTVETTFFREVVETLDVSGTPSPPIGDWINVESSDINGQDSTVWVRKPFAGVEDEYKVSYQVIRPAGATNSSGSKIVAIKELKFKTNSNFIYDKGRIFNDAVWYVANKYCGTIPGMISDFFTCNEDNTAPDNEEYQLAKANLSLLTISQKSDVKRPTAITPKEVAKPTATVSNKYIPTPQQTDPQTKSIDGATKGLLSWEQMEEILKNMFDCYWDIDDNGNLRVEHLSYWANKGTFDLTVEKYALNVKGKGKYEYEKTSMPQIEKFEFMERSYDIDFLGKAIEYKTICVNQQSGENEMIYQVTQVTTDLNLIYGIKEAISDDGFVLFQNFIDTEDEDKVKVKVEEGYISGAPGPNKHLSWANLHYNYHRWGRVMSKGFMNGFETEFSSYIKTKRQDVIRISFCCDDYLNVNSFFKTALSNKGELRSLVHNISDDTIELTINHPTDGTGESPLSRQFDESFDLSFK